MESKKVCKGCLASVRVSDQEIIEAIDKLSRLKKIQFVSDDIYQQRLEICDSCSDLEYGTTCLQCGCIVQIRAKLVDSHCPYPKNRKW
ncbi:hypothetical protein H0486_13235 [Lachnospiraceae bacterium MD1]|jgi:hypothetical protein|uniref:Uncharacterized protein n=1 Tax=Variimorphobacter saccharofermentans TaxID=2755051 RepID=A0A839K2J2_9FIRM|nr:DUF6171 family protein [Variimorphobacter saccharofermentans]MBB2183836.1 hypothetical protein [Variimorphobacter saccharofermentans]